MKHIPTPSSASVDSESPSQGPGLASPFVAAIGLLVMCALLLVFRVNDARSQAEAEGAAALVLIEQLPLDPVSANGQTLPGTLTSAMMPLESILTLKHCQGKGNQCKQVYARRPASDCDLTGTSWQAECVSVPSKTRTGDTLKVRFELQPAYFAAAQDMAVALVLMGGVLFAWRGLARRVARKEDAWDQAKKNPDLDALTGLLNRVAFEAALKRHNDAKIKRGGQSAASDGCLMYFDLDGFKSINDTHGHTVGDQVLRTVAKRLKYTLGNDATIGRLGGDEFAVLLSDVSSASTIEQMGRVLIEQVAKPIQLDAIKDSVGLSIGTFMLTKDALDVGDMLHRADLAMYEAKRTGRGRLVFFDESMVEASRSRAEIQVDLRKAVQEPVQFFMAYQPQVDNHDSIRGVESQVRWRHPTKGVILPGEFIAIAEQTGLIVPLGKIIVDMVCKDLVALRAEKLSLPYVSVNLSLRQLSDTAFVDDVQATLKRYGLSATDVEFEISESTAMLGDGDKENATLKKLSALGFRIAIDDFGSGYSSLVRLLDLKIDKLKIDRVFVAAIGKPRFDPALLELMIGLATRLGVKSVAEGVDSVEQVVWLRQAGCMMMQGNLYAQPMNHSQLVSWLKLQEGDGDFEDGVWAPTQTMETEAA